MASPRGQCRNSVNKEPDYVKLWTIICFLNFFNESILSSPRGLCKVTLFISLELLNKWNVDYRVALTVFSMHAMKSSLIKLILTWNQSRKIIWYCNYYWSFFGTFRIGFIILIYLFLWWLPLQWSISALKGIKRRYVQNS